MKKIIVHIPHSSTLIPGEYNSLFGILQDEIETELLRMTDRYTDELADWPDRLVFPFSRLVCDVERFRDKQKESMAKLGMGVCYTHTSDGKPMKSYNETHEDDILNRYYDPHHGRLSRLAAERIRAYGCCLIVDVHSFSPSPLPYEPDQDGHRPDICIGTDRYHTPDHLKHFTQRFFGEWGYTTAFDKPYSGAITPADLYQREPRLFSIMIEMNRGLYMDSRSGNKTAGYARLKDCLTAYLAAMETQL